MTSEQQQWLRVIEQERLALVAENVRLRRQLATAYWALTAFLLLAACALVFFVS